MLGGRTNHWGRISLRNGPYDFKPHTRDGPAGRQQQRVHSGPPRVGGGELVDEPAFGKGEAERIDVRDLEAVSD